MKIRYAGILAMVPALSACIELGSHWSDETQALYVDYYKAACSDDDAELCFRVRESESDSWEIAEDARLSGFDGFEWGSRYTLTVTTSFDSDGNPSAYAFESIDASTVMAEGSRSFSLTLYSASGVLVQLSDSVWQLGSDISFDCLNSCNAIASAVSSQEVLQLEFSAAHNAITLSSFICSASETDFDSECEGETAVSWYVAPVQSDCGFADAQMCLLYKVNSSDDYELLALEDDISDFEPAWGSRYYIDVISTVSSGGNIVAATLETDDASPDDYSGSSYSYSIIVRGSELTELTSGNWSGYDDMPELDCDQYSQCSELSSYVSDDQWLLLQGFNDTEFVITDIVCHDDVLSDFRDCVDDEDDVNWNI